MSKEIEYGELIIFSNEKYLELFKQFSVNVKGYAVCALTGLGCIVGWFEIPNTKK